MFICVSMYVYMCLLLCFHVSVGLSVSLWVVYKSLCLFVWECISVCLPVSMYSSGSIPSAYPQKERLTGPCGHASHPIGSMVPSWALPGSRIYPPHKTSPHCPPACFYREKRAGRSLEDGNNITVWELCFSTHQGPNKIAVYRCINRV